MVRIGIFRGTFLRHETTALEEALGVAYRTPALPTSVVLLCSATRGHLSLFTYRMADHGLHYSARAVLELPLNLYIT